MLLLHLAALQCTCHPPKRQDHSPERKKETTYPIPRTNTPPHSQVKEAASRSKYLPALKYAQGSLLKKRESSSTREEKKKKRKKITHSITKEQGILQRKHSPGSHAAPTLPSPYMGSGRGGAWLCPTPQPNCPQLCSQGCTPPQVRVPQKQEGKGMPRQRQGPREHGRKCQG